MKRLPTFQWPFARLRVPSLRTIALALLAAWACLLAVAAIRLEGWREELTATLVQLKADAQFRERHVQRRDEVDPEWYRRKSLTLLAAMDRVQTESAWTLVLPGSWHAFDTLEARVTARLAQEFETIVAETVRHELQARATRLTGASGLGGCEAPLPAIAQRQLSGAPEDLPEYVAVRDFVQAISELDEAVRAYAALVEGRPGAPEALRKLVRFTLGAQLPGSLERSAHMFRAHDGDASARLLVSSMQGATRCSLLKGMGALHARLLQGNDLFALEEALLARGNAVFDVSRPPTFDRAVEGYKQVLALLRDQDTLLARGRNGWMRGASLRLGPGYDAMLQRVGGMQLLGSPVREQLDAQSAAAFMRFRAQFDALYGRQQQPGIAWREDEGRFALSAERAALRDGLVALLAEPFMQEDALASPHVAAVSFGAGSAIDEALAWVQARDRFTREALPRWPATTRAAVAKVVDTRVADLVYHRAFKVLRDRTSAALDGSFDVEAYRSRGAELKTVHAALQRLGAFELAHRLQATHEDELVQRLARAQEGAMRLTPWTAAAPDFLWWQGEGAPLWQAMGARDALTVQKLLAAYATRLQAALQEAAPLVQEMSPAAREQPAGRFWTELRAELQRWRAQSPDSSVVAGEQFLMAAGTDLRRENCAQRLQGQVLPANEDLIGMQLRHVQAALLQRCIQLNDGLVQPHVMSGGQLAPAASRGDGGG